MPREDLIQIRRGTASGWTSVNPTLANGEFGFETDTGKLKCGDGSSAWVELGYVSSDVSLQTNPVENEYADITALLADQGNQTETFFQYVIDASADPNVASGDAYYEKLSGSTGTLATDYRLLSDTETQIITDSNGYRVFRIQYIQDDSSPNDTATGGRIGFNYNTGTNKVTSVVFNNIYSNALDIFYAQRASNTYKLKFYNRNTGVYSFATVTGWTVNGNYYIVDVDSGIDISEISVNNRIELFFEIDNGASALEYGTAITGSSTTLTTSNLNTVNRFESASAQTATLNDGVFSLNDEIYFTRTGAGSFELVKGTNVRLTGIRDVENRFFINDKNSWICAKYMEYDGSTEVWQVFGNITRGYTGAVTTLSYSDLFATASAQNVTVNGTGFSSNMADPIITGNATLNSWTYVSASEITLNITSSGSDSDTLDILYDNGDLFLDEDAITLTAIEYVNTNYPFQFGGGLIKLADVTYGIRVRRSSDDAEVDVEFDSNKVISDSSTVSAGGNFSTWYGSDSVYVTKIYNQGDGTGGDMVQATNANQPLLVNAGTLLTLGGLPFIQFNGTSQSLESESASQWGNGRASVTSLHFSNDTSKQIGFNDRPASGLHTFYARVNQNDFNGGNISLNGGTVTADTWYQNTATKRTSESKIYTDGSLIATGGTASDATESNNLRLGIQASGYQDCNINHCIIWKSDEDANVSAIEALINEITGR